MRTLLVVGTFERGGIGEVVYNEARELAKKDEVTIAGLKIKMDPPDNVSARNIATEFLSGLSQYDVIHIHGHTALLGALSLTKGPKIITHHGFFSPQFLPSSQRVEQLMLKRIFGYSIKNCSASIGVDSSLVDELKYMGAKKTFLLYNGVDTSLFRPSVSLTPELQLLRESSNPTLLFVGSLHPLRGLEEVILSLPRLKEKFPKIKFVIVGHSAKSYRNHLKKLSEKIGVSNCTVFYDYVKHADLPQFYNACDVFVHLSLSRQINMGVIEALACGKPVILRNDGANARMLNIRDDDADARMLNKLGVCALVDKHHTFCRAVEQALDFNKPLKAAVNFARSKLDWRAHTNRLRQIYRSALRVSG